MKNLPSKRASRESLAREHTLQSRFICLNHDVRELILTNLTHELDVFGPGSRTTQKAVGIGLKASPKTRDRQAAKIGVRKRPMSLLHWIYVAGEASNKTEAEAI